MRIPKAFLKEAGLRDDVEIEVRGSQIVVQASRRTREGWEEAFSEHDSPRRRRNARSRRRRRSRVGTSANGSGSEIDVFLVSLDPTVGSEIRKTRPCVVVSPDEMNRHLATVMVAPVTMKGRPYPTRVWRARFRGTRPGWCSIRFGRWIAPGWSND